VRGIAPLQTPAADFFRIDTALGTPDVDPTTWRLRVEGMVEAPYELSLAELLALPMVEADITLACVSNEIGGDLVGTARWLGVRAADLLRRARPRAEADMVLSASNDGWTCSTPLAALLDSRPALVAVGMNGAPLTAVHGAPARLVTPGLYGFVGATKWLTRLTVTRYADARAYWTTRGWADRAPVRLAARIDTPRSGAGLTAGTIAVGGVAWSADTGISGVQVRIDDGPWQRAQLGPDLGGYAWRQWWLAWPATAGVHRLTCRAIDGAGTAQEDLVRDVAPDGASGWHSVQLRVG